MLQRVLESLTAFFKDHTTTIEHQSEKVLINKLKKKDLAIDYAEKIIFLADQTDISRTKLYKLYRHKFFKYNNC